MHVVHDDGTEEELQVGHAYVIGPGHNAWVVGDKPFVGYISLATLSHRSKLAIGLVFD
jgi:hypothetical protein